MAHDFYVNNDVCAFEHYKNEGNLDGRLFHIEGNIYGAVFNLMQLAQGRFKDGCFGLVSDGVYDATADGVKVVFEPTTSASAGRQQTTAKNGGCNRCPYR